MLSQSELLEQLQYDPETGIFTRRRGRCVGQAAGSRDSSGHLQIKVAGRSYAAHRLAVLYMTGQWPLEQVDHINQVKTDNRWVNLRPASQSQNCVNRTRPNRVGDGFRGVQKIGNRYQATISIRENGQKRRAHLGMFDSAPAAHAAYLEAARQRHGDFLPTPVWV